MTQEIRANPVATAPEGGEGKTMARRALIAAAGLGVVGVIAAETPAILDGAKKLTEQEISAAIALGRQQLAQELASLEGVGIDLAIDAANIADGAVKNFVVPILKLLAGISEVTLDIASGAVEKAQQFGSLLQIDIQALRNLDDILHQWRSQVKAYPALVQSIADTDTVHAKSYLSRLKEKLKQDAASKPKS